MAMRPPFVPEAVVFDCDGVLLDSEGAWHRAEQAVLAALGVGDDDRVHALLLGQGPAEAARLLAQHLGDGHHPEELGHRLAEAAAAEFARGVPTRPGARELLAVVASRVPVAVATNSRRALAAPALQGAGLLEAVHVLVCAEDVAAPKPAPDPYLVACQRLGARPERTVALEDSPVGVAAAKAAGLWVVACPLPAAGGGQPPVSPADRAAVTELADACVDDLAAIRVEELLDAARG